MNAVVCLQEEISSFDEMIVFYAVLIKFSQNSYSFTFEALFRFFYMGPNRAGIYTCKYYNV